MERQAELQCAAERRQALLDFYSHLILFLAANSLLCVVDLIVPGPWWFHLLLLGWGFVLLAHASGVYLTTVRPAFVWKRKIIDRYPAGKLHN